MEIRDSLKSLRKELGMTQAELGAELHVSNITINRWETGRTVPRARMIATLLRVAKRKGASAHCVDRLQKSLKESHKASLKIPTSALYPVDRESLCQLVDEACIGVLVCDWQTGAVLYANHRAAALFGLPPAPHQACHASLCGLDHPCPGCPKAAHPGQAAGVFCTAQPAGRQLPVCGNRITWDQRPAFVQYYFDEPGSV